jgi:ABC-type multidrug transport system ATPase subunit
LTGRENLELVGQLYHLGRAERPQRAERVLVQFQLAGAADRPVRTYSGGMRRRLDLAASLVGQPPVLILDDPTTGLDPFLSDVIATLLSHTSASPSAAWPAADPTLRRGVRPSHP